jgi:glycerol-3-phosphate dehydrogenase
MKRDLNALGREQFDLVVIGGGINGAATARDAALGGLKVALIEARDFASGTSSRSTKLIHGGLRYLEQFEFALVREARQERRLLLELAPHLARPLPFLLPIYKDDPFSPLKVRLGLAIYDLLGNLGRADRHRMLKAAEALALMPALRREGLRGAALYHDSATDDARLTLENVIDAADHGAVVVNYTEVRAVAAQGGRLTAVEVEDALSGRRAEVSGRLFVNATGPWVDRLRALVPGFDGTRTVRLTKGVHVQTPPVTGATGLLAAIPGEERVFLMWPWQGGALLGTTDTDYEGDPAAVEAEAADTEYLLHAANRVFAEPLRAADLRCPFAGLRALVLEGADAQNPSAVTREYRFHEDRWATNLVSICGGKLTTARALGEKLARLVAQRLGTKLRGASSRSTPFPGGRTGPFEAFASAAVDDAGREFNLEPAVAERIVRTYGSRWRAVLEPMHGSAELGERLAVTGGGGEAPLLAAEAAFAIENEMAMTADDFLLRRSGLSWTGSLEGEARPAIERMLAARADGARETRQEPSGRTA